MAKNPSESKTMSKNVNPRFIKSSKMLELEKRLKKLLEEGASIGSIISAATKSVGDKNIGFAVFQYQMWYTEAYDVIKIFIPDRLKDFEQLYKRENRKKVDIDTYTLSDFCKGMELQKGFHSLDIASSLMATQLSILKSVERKLESSLMNIKTLTQADLFDSELEVAKELKKKGFLRSAGVVAGVVLESHLKTILSHHNIALPKKKSLSKYNDQLHNNKIIDVEIWRNIQLLTDLRNLCCHSKDKEPTKQNVSDLIDGVSKMIETVSSF